MSTQHLFCRDCGYILDGVRDNCPECSRRFDPDHPATFSRCGPRERSIRKWLTWCARFRAAFFILFGLLLITPISLMPELVHAALGATLFVLPLLLAATLATLFIAAFKLRGAIYAIGYVFMAMVLTPFFGIRLVVILTQVHSDVAETFKSSHEDGPD